MPKDIELSYPEAADAVDQYIQEDFYRSKYQYDNDLEHSIGSTLKLLSEKNLSINPHEFKSPH